MAMTKKKRNRGINSQAHRPETQRHKAAQPPAEPETAEVADAVVTDDLPVEPVDKAAAGGENAAVDDLVAEENREKSGKNEKPAEKRGPRYAFPSLSRCPRCGATDTQATSTQGDKQYRKCLRGHCRWSYCVIGKKV